MTRRRLNVKLVVVEDGVPIHVYPESGFVVINDDYEEGVEAFIGEDGSLTVMIDLTTLAALASGMRDGEALEVKTPEALEALYRLAKALSEAIHGKGNPLNAYTAYKAIESLEEEGRALEALKDAEESVASKP